jgi:hypothetical protein
MFVVADDLLFFLNVFEEKIQTTLCFFFLLLWPEKS